MLANVNRDALDRTFSTGLAHYFSRSRGIELVVAAHTEDSERLASEAADLLYHLLVLRQACRVPLDAVWPELEKRKR